jgi:hypothetical protein
VKIVAAALSPVRASLRSGLGHVSVFLPEVIYVNCIQLCVLVLFLHVLCVQHVNELSEVRLSNWHSRDRKRR